MCVNLKAGARSPQQRQVLVANDAKFTEEQERKIRYEPDEQAPLSVCMPVAIQSVAACAAGIIAIPTVMMDSAGIAATHGIWCVFASLLVCGSMTVLLSMRWGRIGAGYPLIIGSAAPFVAISISAITAGGTPLLATLTVVAALVQYLLCTRLVLLRRIITPVVAGIMLVLVAASIAQVVLGLLGKPAPDGSTLPSLSSSAATMLSMTLISILAKGWPRLFVAIIGIAVGCLVYMIVGTYDLSLVSVSAWIGMPPAAKWPGFDLSFGPDFWALLPPFVMVSVVIVSKITGDVIAVQRIAWRQPRTANFKEVQGGITVNSLSCFLSGLFGTVPTFTWSSNMLIIESAGVTARRVGICTGLTLAAIAFSPKLLALLLTIPIPVASGCLLMMTVAIFNAGLRIIVRDGLDTHKSLLVGISLWVGISASFQTHTGTELSVWESFLGNSLTAGGLTAILLAILLKISTPLPKKMRTKLEMQSLPAINALLKDLATAHGWGEKAIKRLYAAGEEVMLVLTHRLEEQAGKRNLLLAVEANSKAVTMEFIASAAGDENLSDQIALLSTQADFHVEEHLPLRIIKGITHSVHHQQYHSTDIITAKVTSS